MKVNLVTRWVGFGSVLMALLALSACGPLPPRHQAPARERIATLRVTGPHIIINGRRAVDGESYYAGDTLATGQGSSARLDLSDGGVVQLNENTDFSVRQLRQAVTCIWNVLFDVGDVLVKNGNSCQMQTETPDAKMLSGSEVIVHSTRQSTTVTLFYGSLRLLRPVPTTLTPGDQLTVERGAVVERRTLFPLELRRVREWVERYRFPPLVGVPAVGGLALDAAHQRLKRAGLRLGGVSNRRDQRYRPGTVVEQVPQAGTRVPEGTVVRLTVAVQPPPVVVPNLVGVDLGTARGGLQRYKLVPGRVIEVVNPQYRPGVVVGMSPNRGQNVPEGTRIDLYVAKAPLVAVPNLVGANLGTAQGYLQQHNLIPGQIIQVVNPRYRPGVVVGSSPPPGQNVPAGTRVDLYVAKQELKRVPSLAGRTVSQARQILDSARLQLGRSYVQPTNRAQSGTIFNQSPSAGQMLPPGSRVDVYVAATVYPIVPDVRRQTVVNAGKILSRVGLRIVVVETRVIGVGGYHAGEIFDQYPRPGTKVRPGQTISVRVQGTIK